MSSPLFYLFVIKHGKGEFHYVTFTQKAPHTQKLPFCLILAPHPLLVCYGWYGCLSQPQQFFLLLSCLVHSTMLSFKPPSDLIFLLAFPWYLSTCMTCVDTHIITLRSGTLIWKETWYLFFWVLFILINPKVSLFIHFPSSLFWRHQSLPSIPQSERNKVL